MHSTLVTVTFELIGVLVVAMFAGFSDDFGKIAVIFMFGVLLWWVINHSGALENWIGKGSTSNGKANFLNV